MKHFVRFPFGGVSDAQAFSDQRPLTTRDAQNVRGRDGMTGRWRGSKRSGMRKYTLATVSGAFKIQYQNQVVYDGMHVSYANASPTPTDVAWSKETPAKDDARGIAIDRQGNVYVLNGPAGVVKYNRDGTLLWTFSLPAADASQVCRAIAVDSSDQVYVGVSSGTTQFDAKLWRLRQLPNNGVEVAWTINLEAFVEAFALHNGRLYTVQNWADRFEARVVIYSSILTSIPVAAQSWRTAYPCVDIAVKQDGSVFTASPPFADRGRDPRFPGFTQRTVDWRKQQLTDWHKRAWFHTTANAIVEQEGLTEDDAVELLPDLSGNERHWYFDQNLPRPTVNARAGPGFASIRFNGRNTGGGAGLRSEPNQSISAAAADQQKTPTPAYVGNRWVAIMLLRVPYDDAAGVNRPAFSWDNAGTGANAEEKHLCFNRVSAATAGAGGGGASQGSLSWHEDAAAGAPGAGAGGRPLAALWNQVYTAAAATAQTGLGTGLTGSANGFVLVTIACDGGAGGAEPTFHSLLRINGKPWDRWQSAAPSEGLELARFGSSFVAGFTALFQGELIEMVVFRDWPAISPAADVVMTHPKYPRTVGLLVAGAGQSNPNNWVASGDSELERVEGEIMHEHGLAHLLPGANVGAAIAGTAVPVGGSGEVNYATTFAPAVTPPALTPNIGHFPHPFYQPWGPPRSGGVAVESQPWLLNSVHGVLAKFSAAGEVVWVLTNRTAVNWSGGLFAAVDRGGVGHGVRIDPSGNVFSCGPMSTLSGGTQETEAVVRKIIDQGSTFSLAGADGAWARRLSDFANVGAVTGPDSTNCKMAVDTFGNLFMPWYDVDSANAFSLVAFTPTGGRLFNLGGGNEFFEATGLISCPQGFAVVVDPEVPQYQTGGPTRARFFYLATDRGRLGSGGPIAGMSTVWKVPTVTVTATTGSARSHRHIVVSNGRIKKVSVTRNAAGVVTASSITSPAGAGTLAQPELGTAVDFIDGFVLFGRLYFVDGLNYVYYKAREDTALRWESSTGGTIPLGARLGCAWRGRALLSRFPDKPHNIIGSAMGLPDDFDVFPAKPRPQQAFDLSANAAAGQCPDLVNTLFPWSDDILVVGGDHSIFTMTGDPMSGGQWDDVSRTIGMPFGRTITRDERGVGYFLGSPAGIYRWVPGHIPEQLTDDDAHRRLSAFNHLTHYIELVWDTVDEGLHILAMPYAHSAFPHSVHYFWERASGRMYEGALWPDLYGSAANHPVQPSSVLVIDGDQPNDRRVVYGCEDGFMRELERTAATDDGLPIDGYVLLGPISAGDAMETMFHGFSVVFANTQGPTHWEFYTTDTPDVLGPAVRRGTLKPGRNPMTRFCARGQLGYLLLRSADPIQGWSLEGDVEFEVSVGSESRRR